GDEFVDRGVDRRVLAADTGTGEEPGEEEVPGCERECRRHSGDQVETQGDDEQLLPAEPVGELAEEERPQAGADDVDRPGQADLCRADVQTGPVLGEPGSDTADHRDLETVEDPDTA